MCSELFNPPESKKLLEKQVSPPSNNNLALAFTVIADACQRVLDIKPPAN